MVENIRRPEKDLIEARAEKGWRLMQLREPDPGGLATICLPGRQMGRRAQERMRFAQ
jgi:hypothetical protein